MKLKKLLLILFTGAALFSGNCALWASAQKPVSASSLDTIEIFTNGEISTEARFIFNGPFRFQKNVSPKDSHLKLFFSNARLGGFDKEKTLSQFYESGMVKRVSIEHHENGLAFDIKFYDNKVLVKLNKTKDGNQLILEIYSKEILGKIRNSIDGPLFLTQNFTAALEGKKKRPYRIVLDAGHGGAALGAVSAAGLREKEVALDVAKRAEKLLKTAGFNVLMTRRDDSDVSLLERSNIAKGTNPDLLVSIHANSSPNSKKVSGVETYFPSILEGVVLWDQAHGPENFSAVAKTIAQKKVTSCEKLATNIHENVLGILRTKKQTVSDRGIKQESFRVISRGLFPAVLVEVGFLTNKAEASRLATPNYRQLLAQGIFLGIKQFIQ